MTHILFIVDIASFVLVVMHCLSDWKILKLEGFKDKIIPIIYWKIRFAIGVIALELFLTIANSSGSLRLICFIAILVLDVFQLRNLDKG